MTALLKLHILRPLRLLFLPLPVPSPRLRTLPPSRHHRIPQRPHMLLRHNLVLHPAQHQYRRRRRDQGDLVYRVPFLVAQEGDRAEDREGVRDERGEGGEGVFEDEGGDSGRVFRGEVDGDGSADGLAVENLKLRIVGVCM